MGNKTKKKHRVLALLMAFMMVFSMIPTSAFAAEQKVSYGTETVKAETRKSTKVTYTDALNSVLATLKNGKNLGVGSLNGEWAVLSLARGGVINGTEIEGQTVNYLEAVQTALNSGKLKNPTDFARVTLALSALGFDAPQKMIEQCTDYDKTERQGINAVTYCLLALNTKPYDAEVCEKYISYIVEHTCNDGGWVFGSDTSATADVDITAMVIQALAPYYGERDDVTKAVDDALNALKSMQKEAGGFESYSTYNAASTAQVIVALTSLGMDPTEWNGKDAVNALLQFYDSTNGMFAYMLDSTKNQMATEQAAYALVAYSRFKNEATSLYDMKDAFAEDGSAASEEQAAASAVLEVVSEFKEMKLSMEDGNTKETVKAWLEAQLAALNLTGVSAEVEVAEVTAVKNPKKQTTPSNGW